MGALTNRPDSAFNVSATLVINWIALVLLAFLGSLRKHPFLLALRRWGRRRKRETSPAAKSEEKRMFSQANS